MEKNLAQCRVYPLSILYGQLERYRIRPDVKHPKVANLRPLEDSAGAGTGHVAYGCMSELGLASQLPFNLDRTRANYVFKASKPALMGTAPCG